jgi:DsbC/DsbD-like thiol-disulfide interchange protein
MAPVTDFGIDFTSIGPAVGAHFPDVVLLAGLAEELFVYTGKVAVSLPVTLTAEGDDQTLHVTIRYQACSATDCFLPSTVTLSLPLQTADHIDRPRRR